MATNHVTLWASDVMKDATVEITVRCRGFWRVRLGLWIVRLGVRLMGCGCKVTEESGEES